MTIELAQIVDFIRREVGLPTHTQLTTETNLRSDLRMIEDDADELLAKFSKEFGVDPGDFDLNRYFPPEGLWLLRLKSPSPPPVRLTLGMLYRAACNGVWNTTEIESRTDGD